MDPEFRQVASGAGPQCTARSPAGTVGSPPNIWNASLARPAFFIKQTRVFPGSFKNWIMKKARVDARYGEAPVAALVLRLEKPPGRTHEPPESLRLALNIRSRNHLNPPIANQTCRLFQVPDVTSSGVTCVAQSNMPTAIRIDTHDRVRRDRDQQSAPSPCV